MAQIGIGIVTCSDRCSRGEQADTAGAALVELCASRGWAIVEHVVCADDASAIGRAIVRQADELGVDVVFTTGGTGLGPRDVTPEATLAIAEREVPGIAEALRSLSLRVTRRAMLSRSVAAQRGQTLVVNLPGSEKAARETFSFVEDQIEHAVEMMAGLGHD